jgi:protocatechuate 3,4-dioxygenase beta subunit
MPDGLTKPIISRRQFMQGSAAATVGLLLAACGANGVDEVTPSAVAQTAATDVPAMPTTVSAVPTDAAATTVIASSTETPILQPTPECGDDDDDETPAQTEGPYYTPNTPERTSFWEAGTTGTRLVVTGQVLTTGCVPVAAALIDFWHADDNGVYDNEGYKLRGHQFTDANGNFTLDTIVPGLYPGRTRHIHVKVQGPNMPILTTQLYFPNEPQNASDGIYSPELLMDVQDAADGQAATFNFVLA